MKFFIIIFGIFFINSSVFCQDKTPVMTRNVKTRYYIETIYSPSGTKHADTLHFELFNPEQKATVYNTYSNNRVNSSAVVTINKKNETTAITDYTGKVMTGRQDFFYDNQGNIVLSVKHHFYKTADGKVAETKPDSSVQSFDKAGNKILMDNTGSKEQWFYDKQNHLIEQDFYLQKNGKAQQTYYNYRGKVLMETLYKWYDGKLYHRRTNNYDEHQQLIHSRDSATLFFQEIDYAYDLSGHKTNEVTTKNFQGTNSKTVAEFTYDQQGRVLMENYHSNDRLLQFLFPFSSRVKSPDFVLKQIHSYDRYGNRLKISTELNGQLVRDIDFLMTYY